MSVIQVADCQTAADVRRVLRLSAARRKALSTPKPRPQLTVVADEPPPDPPVPVEPPVSLWVWPTFVEALQPKIADEPVIPRSPHQEILRAVARDFGVAVRDILGPSRITALVTPRHVAMYLMREILGFTFPQIGRACHRDHTVPILACSKSLKELDRNTELACRIRDLEDLIRARLRKPKGTVFRFVTHARADGYLKLGWLPTTALLGTYHGQFSVLIKWICPTCPAVEPKVTLK
jgi:hypothetical protein